MDFCVAVNPETSAMLQKLAFKKNYTWTTMREGNQKVNYINQPLLYFRRVGKRLEISYYTRVDLGIGQILCGAERITIERAISRLKVNEVNFKGISINEEEFEQLKKEFGAK